MSYDAKYRAKAVAFKSSGHTFKELKSVFGVSCSSYYDWTKLKETTGFYAPTSDVKRTRKSKIDPAALKAAVAAKPDAYLRELAEQFGCAIPSIHHRLKKLGLTLKKRRLPILKSPKKTAPTISKR